MVKMKSMLVMNQNKEITFQWDGNNLNDEEIIRKIKQLIADQPSCEKCKNYKEDSYFCGYLSHKCIVHGNIEFPDHPHHDLDASKCSDYLRDGE